MTILDISAIILWIVSIVCLVNGLGSAWLVVIIITSIYLFIRGILFLGFDLDDLF